MSKGRFGIKEARHMQTPLYGAINEYIARGRARFHTPGHKGKLAGPLSGAAPFDITEVDGTDCLYMADGVIAKIESEYAALYGAAGSFLSAGGSTLCIQAMLASALKPGDKLICARGVHVAAVGAMALLDLHPVWVYPSADPCGLAGAAAPAEIRRLLEKHPDAGAVYLTSPDYYGIISDIESISGVCGEFGVPLLVDNAHGAHLKFLEAKLHPMDLGADLCCDSLHKTLPVLTGGALLHCGNPMYLPEIKNRMSLFGSTSPSYLIMLSCDMALPYLRDGAAADLARVCGRMKGLMRDAEARGFAVPSGELDPLRLTVGFGAMGWGREEFGRYIRGAGIEPEYLGEEFCVFLAGAHTSEKDVDRLGKVILSCGRKTRKTANSTAAGLNIYGGGASAVMSIREAMFSPRECIPAEKSLGRIVAGVAVPCPPGIPIALPGELVDENLHYALNRYGILSINVIK